METASGHPNSRLGNYHRLVLTFALLALDRSELPELLQRATESVREGISARMVKILQHRVVERDLLVVAGVGWKPGVVGHASLPLGMRSPAGRSVETRAAVKIDDLPNAKDYDYSDLLREHEIASLINVPIDVEGAVWGILEVDSTDIRRFDGVDEEFLFAFARIVGRTIELKRRAETAEAQRRDLAIELREREVLFAELRHRIANQLHAAAGILEVARRRVIDLSAKAELERVIARVAAMVTTNEQLSLAQVESEISLGAYLTRLGESFAKPEKIEIVRTIGDATVPLRVAVRLGLIVNELVTNAIKHAFDQGRGIISITLTAAEQQGVLAVADNGHGMRPARPRSSGTALVASLAAQVGATVAIATGAEGTTVTLRFPARHPA